MSTGLDRIEWSKFPGIGGLLHWPEQRPLHLKGIFVWLPLALVTGLGAWVLLTGDRGGVARSEPVHLTTATAGPAPVSAGDKTLSQAPYDPMTAEAIVPDEPTPLDRMTILRQSWRRSGLGSNALITFTLRNNNHYAVKNVEIACAFSGRDGSYVTDRTRLIPDTVRMKSRKTFARMHIGFVNVNANKAKCSLVAASRI